MTRDALDPIADSVVPVYAAYGRSVLVAGAVEKVLLVDLVRRHVDVDGLTEEIGELINDLERRSAGTIAGRLRGMGIDGDLATRIARFVEQRNQIVHRWAESPQAMAALVGADTKPAIDQLDEFALECEQLVNLIGPEAFERASAAFDAKPEEIVAFIRDLDVGDVEDPDRARELGVVQARLAVIEAAEPSADAAPSGEDAGPGEPADGVYALYGRVMMAVQYWELALAMTWWQRTTPPNANRGAADSRASKKAVTRLERAFTKVTAGQALPELRDELPADLHESLTRLQDDRNRLAHRVPARSAAARRLPARDPRRTR